MRKILLVAATLVPAPVGSSIIAPTADSLSATSPVIASAALATRSEVARPAATGAPTRVDQGRGHAEHALHASGEIATSLRPTVVVRGGSAEQHERVDEALARFVEAGLPLPDLDVVFADDPTRCGGHDGLFLAEATPWRVMVCSELAFVVTHEFAHAWEAANLDDDDRARYVERRGLSTWNSNDAGWGERGVEDLAFMMQQNLMAGNVSPTSERWVERADAYGWATGRRSPVLPAVDGRSPLR